MDITLDYRALKEILRQFEKDSCEVLSDKEKGLDDYVITIKTFSDPEWPTLVKITLRSGIRQPSMIQVSYAVGITGFEIVKLPVKW